MEKLFIRQAQLGDGDFVSFFQLWQLRTPASFSVLPLGVERFVVYLVNSCVGGGACLRKGAWLVSPMHGVDKEVDRMLWSLAPKLVKPDSS